LINLDVSSEKIEAVCYITNGMVVNFCATSFECMKTTFLKHHVRSFGNFMKLASSFSFFKAKAPGARPVWMEKARRNPKLLK
jgi:hypothetical protein